jgi:UDP-glucose 4-epimerase
MTKIYITGAAGFIGSNLVTKLLSNTNYSVIGIDDLSYGNLSNMNEFINHSRFEFNNDDFLDYFKNRNISDSDVLVHLAAKKIPRYGGALEVIDNNLVKSIILFRTFASRKAKIIFASTADIYGKLEKIPFMETDNSVFGAPDVSRWTYASSKYVAEQYLYELTKEFESPGISLRFFGGYGPRMGLDWKAGPIPVFYNYAKNKESMPVHGDGLQTRSFTFVEDYTSVLEATLKIEFRENLTLNVGSQEEISVKDLASKVWKIVNPNEEVKIEYVPYESFGKYEDVRRRVPSIDRLLRVTGLTCSTKIDFGLLKTIDWIEESNKKP